MMSGSGSRKGNEQQHQKLAWMQKCSHEGCNKYVQKDGTCWMHLAKAVPTNFGCTHDGCTNYVVKGGVCIKHGAKAKKCSRDGCNNNAKKGGVCIRHGAKLILPIICSVEGCTNQAKTACRGVCLTHEDPNTYGHGGFTTESPLNHIEEQQQYCHPITNHLHSKPPWFPPPPLYHLPPQHHPNHYHHHLAPPINHYGPQHHSVNGQHYPYTYPQSTATTSFAPPITSVAMARHVRHKISASPSESLPEKNETKKRIMGNHEAGEHTLIAKDNEAGDCDGPAKKKAHRLCSAEGCNNQAQKGGVCGKHGGKPMCSYDGCTNQVQNGTVCIRHGAKVKMCSRDGCANQVQKGGVCIRHAVKVTHKTCSHEGCTDTAQKGGVCWRHVATVVHKPGSQGGFTNDEPMEGAEPSLPLPNGSHEMLMLRVQELEGEVFRRHSRISLIRESIKGQLAKEMMSRRIRLLEVEIAKRNARSALLREALIRQSLITELEDEMSMRHVSAATLRSVIYRVPQETVTLASQVGPAYSLKDIANPHAHDVLCGRGHVSNTHSGNAKFRRL